MMGTQAAPERLFYDFCLDDQVPDDHLLRQIDGFLDLISQRYERGSIIITSNLPFDEWTQTFGTERLTGALLDRLTHHVHILEMNGDSYRLKHSRSKQKT